MLKIIKNTNIRTLLFTTIIRPRTRKYSIRKLDYKINYRHDISLDIRKKIVYSSVLENEKSNIGYKRKKIMENIIEKEKKQNQLNRINIKPFPATLKSLGIDTNIYSNSDELNKTNIESHRQYMVQEKPNEFQTSFPNNWMEDYEYFEGYDDGVIENMKYGTPDSQVPISKIACNGCGAKLHCADIAFPGYIPSEIFKGRSETELKTIICQRCHFLKNYNIALDVTVSPEDYIKTLAAMTDKYALALLIVDLLDFPCSIWPEIQEILGTKRPIFVVGNKVDLLPKDSRGYLDHIKKCLTNSVLDTGLSKLNLKHTCLVSAKTGYGIEELITQLHKIWAYKGDVYLVGCANVGKSSIFNALLRSDYCKVQAIDLVKRATTCPWPGTTLQMLKFPILRPSDIRVYQRYKRLFSDRAQRLAEEKLRKDQLKKTGNTKYATLIGHIGMTFKQPAEAQDIFSMSQGVNPILTLNEKSKEYQNSKWCYDTPGVIHPDQIHNLLTTEELLMLNPKEMIIPRVLKFQPHMTLFLAGLGRIDFVKSNIDFIRISVYSSTELPLLITHTKYADEIYENLLGSDLLGVPVGNMERLKKWPGLESSESIEIKGENEDIENFDILLSSAGWIGINLSYGKICEFKAWTPEKRGVVLRKPALIPYGENLRGSKVRGSIAYNKSKPFTTTYQ